MALFPPDIRHSRHLISLLHLTLRPDESHIHSYRPPSDLLSPPRSHCPLLVQSISEGWHFGSYLNLTMDFILLCCMEHNCICCFTGLEILLKSTKLYTLTDESDANLIHILHISPTKMEKDILML